MPVTQNKPGPYAPASAVLEVVTRYRSRGLLTPVNNEVLARAGISESLLPRTIQALQTLDLINKEGMPTQTLDGLQRAPESEFRERLADWVRGAYAEVFKFVDPTTDDSTRIRDAFRSYQPIGQQDRMVSLFQGLCAAAGLAPEKPVKVAAPRQPRPVQTRTPSSPARPPMRPPMRSRADASSRHESGLPAPLAGLLAGLPGEGQGWPQDRRDKFMTAFGTVLDLCFPIVASAQEEEAA